MSINRSFLVNALDIIDEYELSTILKAKIKNRLDLGKDERISIRIIFNFNESYPIVMSPDTVFRLNARIYKKS